MILLNLLNRLMELFQDTNSEINNAVKDLDKNKLFEVDYSNDTLKFLDESSLSYDKLKELVLKEELKALSSQINAELTTMAQNGSITPETFESMRTILDGGINKDSIKQLKELANSLEEPQISETYIDSADIDAKLDELDVDKKKSIMEHVGEDSSITSLEILDNGSYRIKTSDNNTIVAYSSGEITVAYDDNLKTGFDVYNSENKLQSSFYVDHTKENTLVYENYKYNEDGSYTETIDTSASPNTQKIISVNAESQITNVEILIVKQAKLPLIWNFLKH